ncbi:MAG: L-glutamate gamma-semialdehyde dehydrogenase [Myxococcales bacterium]|nr:L-glutamate gamma-semialdehyde dehydrogenase [Myxococcales bacterium]
MYTATWSTPRPINDTVRVYAPGSPERASLKAALTKMATERPEIGVIIGGKEYFPGNVGTVLAPFNRRHALALFHRAGEEEVKSAIDSAMKARRHWASLPWDARAAVFLRAAELAAGPFRDLLNASTMLGQGKTVMQAEIDAACELVDFFRFNAYYARRLMDEQPASPPGVWNRMEQRPLEGFVFAVAPFNFTSIAANLPTAPVICGNVALFKPAETATLSGYVIMKVLEAAGLPPGVIQFLPGHGSSIADVVLRHPDLGGVHFTGSTTTFREIWSRVGQFISSYRSYPRIVGETGGKGFVVVHPTADVAEVAVALVRGAFEYQGQKCSAASRAYVPQSLYNQLAAAMENELSQLTMGDVLDFRHFLSAVIDARAYSRIKGFVDRARENPKCKIIFGGNCSDEIGYFIEPTVILTQDPKSETMVEEIFGPVLTVFVYADSDWENVLELVDQSTSYALTGSVFARDRRIIVEATTKLAAAAGNFYINDKPTGAVVGQQPFGGARASGTNDKAGSPLNLMRWVSPRTIKETFVPPRQAGYPVMGEK